MRRAPGARGGAVLVGLLLTGAAVGLIQLDRRGVLPDSVRGSLLRVVSPIVEGVTRAARGLRSVWLDRVALAGVREENKRLLGDLDRLRDQVAQAAGLEQENVRLRALLELGERRKDLRLLAAHVVSRSMSPYFRVLRVNLDVGAAEVTEGMPVIAPGGVVGQIRTLAGDRAEVLLVTDPRSAIDVVLERSGARGVAVGTGEADRYAARIEYLQRAAEVSTGERVLTTGDDGRYPRGLVVGELTRVGDAEGGAFRKAELVPAVDLGGLEEVFIVLGPTGLTPDGKALQRDEPVEAPPE